ncbi:hypothetical protein ACFWFI_03705 [Streptomyces sp. NPDC060209]|uniref:hypothetical protein n=1 Tax=Streptomyces sp. NPDC060209 TaxID=3347073 RepID=UPI00364AA58E
MDTRLTRPVREAMAQRFAWTAGGEQAYTPEEFGQIRLAARRTFRAALLRIRENTAHLTAWREGTFAPGSREWLLGKALDVLARTGDVPVYENRRTVAGATVPRRSAAGRSTPGSGSTSAARRRPRWLYLPPWSSG